MKNQSGSRVATALYTELYIRCSSSANSEIGGRVWRILLLNQAFKSVLDTCKTEENPFKNEGARVVIKISPIVCLCRFFMMKAVKSTV